MLGAFEEKELGVTEECADGGGAVELLGAVFGGPGFGDLRKAEALGEFCGLRLQLGTGAGGVVQGGEQNVFVDVEIADPGIAFKDAPDAAAHSGGARGEAAIPAAIEEGGVAGVGFEQAAADIGQWRAKEGT